MPVLTLDYRHCDRKRPRYIKRSEVEGLAALVRQQLVDATTDALSVDLLSAVSGLKINGVAFDLFVGTSDIVHDEDGNPVLGICEYDPGVPDTAMVSVSPVGENAGEELVLSTLAHELGHAIFDGPGWIVDASRGPGLFDGIDDTGRKMYRTTTRDVEHLAKAPTAGDGTDQAAPGKSRGDEYFAELRANEFMGSLLVPRLRLNTVVEELAPEHDVKIVRSSSLDPDRPGTSLTLVAEGDFGFLSLDMLQRSVAKRFGVSPRFVQVRMDRYGLLKAGDLPS
jgi:hypothetical protein